MIDAWNSFKIREFEHVTAGRDTALLRISGRASRRRAVATSRPTLLADDGQTVHRFAALPSPPDARGVMRAAFSVAALKVTPDTTFSLELADGTTLPLPSPTRGAARFGPAAPAAPASEPPAVHVAEPEVGGGGPGAPEDEVAHDRRAEALAKLAELSEALADSERATQRAHEQVAIHEERLAAAQTEAAQLRERLTATDARAVAAERRAGEGDAQASAGLVRGEEADQRASELQRQLEEQRERAAQAEAANAQTAATLAELETWREELERRLAATTSELDAAKSATEGGEQEAQRLRGELTESEATLELAHAEIRNLTQRVDALDGERTAERTEHQAETERMAAEVSRLQAEHDEAVTSAQAAADERINALQAERDQAVTSAQAAADERINALQAERDQAVAAAEGATERIRTLEAESSGHAHHAEQLASERQDLARRAEQLVALLAPTEALAELAQDLGHARVQAESLYSAASAPPSPAPAPPARAPDRQETPPEGAVTEPEGAGDEPEGAADEPERRADAPPLDDETLARLSRGAEARAREQAERELLQALADGQKLSG